MAASALSITLSPLSSMGERRAEAFSTFLRVTSTLWSHEARLVLASAIRERASARAVSTSGLLLSMSVLRRSTAFCASEMVSRICSTCMGPKPACARNAGGASEPCTTSPPHAGGAALEVRRLRRAGGDVDAAEGAQERLLQKAERFS
jgi:hypothetical protein